MKYLGKCLLIKDAGNGKKKEKILAVGDMHIGFEEVLNDAGVLISRQMFDEIISDFDKIFEKTGKVDSVILLGDVKHNFGRILRQEWNDILGLFDYLLERCKEIVIVEGNHDVILEPILRGKKNIYLKNYFISGSYAFIHGTKDFPEIWDKKIKYIAMGHYHPAVRISEGVKSEMYKCFLSGKHRGKEVIIVPSFFPLVEGSDPRENEIKDVFGFNFDKFDVKVVSGNLEVLDFGKLEKLKRD